MAKDKTYYQQFLTNSNVVAYLNAISFVEAPTYYTKGGGQVIVPTGPEHPAGELVNGSDAYGRYQFISTTWKEVSDSLGGLDIRQPRDQDVAAIAKLDSLGYLDAVVNGDCITASNGVVGTWDGIRAVGGAEAFCSTFNGLKGTTLPQGPFVNNNVPTGTSPANNPNNNSFTFGNTNFADIKCPPIKEEDLYRANYQITNPGCKISGPIQPITGPSTNGGTVNNVKGTNKAGGFSVNSQGFAACTSLRSPIKEGDAVFTSGYGWRWGRMHYGVDMAGPVGTPIYAASNGTIKYAAWAGGYGNYIELLSPENILTMYAHLIAFNCSVGQQVTVGQQIGEMGSTGNSTGPHLHFEVDLGNGKIDPEDCIRFR
jgi:hypothetical protein